MPFAKLAAACLALSLAATPALAWKAQDDGEGKYILQLGDLSAPMTGMQVYCANNEGPAVFLIVPEDRRDAYPDNAWGAVEVDGQPFNAYLRELLDGYHLYDDETGTGAAKTNAALVAAMKAGGTATVVVSDDGRFVPLGTLDLRGFTRAYDGLGC